jgi:hypothetical protein
MKERRVEKKGDDQMARREWGRTCSLCFFFGQYFAQKRYKFSLREYLAINMPFFS